MNSATVPTKQTEGKSETTPQPEAIVTPRPKDVSKREMVQHTVRDELPEIL